MGTSEHHEERRNINCVISEHIPQGKLSCGNMSEVSQQVTATDHSSSVTVGTFEHHEQGRNLNCVISEHIPQVKLSCGNMSEVPQQVTATDQLRKTSFRVNIIHFVRLAIPTEVVCSLDSCLLLALCSRERSCSLRSA